MLTSVRGKFTVTEKTEFNWTGTQKKIVLRALYDEHIEEDRRYAKATPSAEIILMVDNAEADKFLSLGSKFYVDFTQTDLPVVAEEVAPPVEPETLEFVDFVDTLEAQ